MIHDPLRLIERVEVAEARVRELEAALEEIAGPADRYWNGHWYVADRDRRLRDIQMSARATLAKPG